MIHNQGGKSETSSTSKITGGRKFFGQNVRSFFDHLN
jgi:hypothetical protein